MSIISVNPLGLISLVNSLNELTTFQLINLNPIFPQNINDFFNISSFISFDFISTQIENYFSVSTLYYNCIFENNLSFHHDFSDNGFFYNLVLLCFPIVLLVLVVKIVSIIPNYFHIFNYLKQLLNPNFLIAIYLGTFYDLMVTSLSELVYEDYNINFITFLSRIISSLILGLQIIFIPFSLGILHTISLRKEEFEYSDDLSILYQELLIREPEIFLDTLNNLKIQFLILICFSIQHFSIPTLIIFIIIYSISLLALIRIIPYDSRINNFKRILKELLFLFLSICLLFYYFFEKDFDLNVTIYMKVLMDCALVIIILIVSLEILFILFDAFAFFADLSCSKKVSTRLKNALICDKLIREIILFKSNPYNCQNIENCFTCKKRINQRNISFIPFRNFYTYTSDIREKGSNINSFSKINSRRNKEKNSIKNLSKNIDTLFDKKMKEKNEILKNKRKSELAIIMSAGAKKDYPGNQNFRENPELISNMNSMNIAKIDLNNVSNFEEKKELENEKKSQNSDLQKLKIDKFLNQNQDFQAFQSFISKYQVYYQNSPQNTANNEIKKKLETEYTKYLVDYQTKKKEILEDIFANPNQTHNKLFSLPNFENKLQNSNYPALQNTNEFYKGDLRKKNLNYCDMLIHQARDILKKTGEAISKSSDTQKYNLKK